MRGDLLSAGDRRARGRLLRRRALRIVQDPRHPLYVFSLRADELIALADVSRLSRGNTGELIGYQRPEVRQHVKNITKYLNSNGGEVLFPNSIILALGSDTVFRAVRGPKVDRESLAEAGTLEFRLPAPGQPKPAWLVDGQQRTLALSRCQRRDFPVPVSAFVADDVDTQREQFLRVNSTKPLPRGLISELLPTVDTVLPPRLAARKAPAALCDLLARDPESPFYGLIRRSSSAGGGGGVVADTSLIQVLQDSLTHPSGCLFSYRNLATGETDFQGVQKLLHLYWSAVRALFPDAWGRAPSESRLMHSVGLRAMGKLMDRVMATVDVDAADAAVRVHTELVPLRSVCRWTSGTWDDLNGLRWNELQNVASHVRMLTNCLMRAHMTRGRGSP